MSEDREKQDRWRALAEELGLPPEPPGDKPAPPAPTPPAEVTTPAVAAPTPEPAPPPPPEIVEKPMPLFDAEPACVPAVPEMATPPVVEQVDLPPITNLDPLDEPGLSVPAFAEEAPAEEPRSPAPEDRPRGRGGRRGQRSRRGRNGERTEDVRSAPAPEAGPSEEGAAPRDRPPSGFEEAPREERRRRGRGRRPAERPPDPEDSFVETEAEPFPAAPEVDDGPEDNLADLNVPAWADLISSLYRPDR